MLFTAKALYPDAPIRISQTGINTMWLPTKLSHFFLWFYFLESFLFPGRYLSRAFRYKYPKA